MSSGRFECSLCQVQCATEQTLSSHLRGRPHQRMLDRQRQVARVVFVRGFPKHVTLTSDLLMELFTQYGEVEHVFISTDVYALVTFKTEASAESALAAPPSLEGKPLVVKPRSVKPHKPANKPTHMEVERSLSHALQCSVPVSEDGLKLIRQAHTFNDQVALLSTYGATSDESIKHILSLCEQLKCRLSSLYPDCVLLPFGSVITTHGTTTSDCDLTLLTHPHSSHLTPHTYYPPHMLELSKQPLPSQPMEEASSGSTQSTPERPIRSQDKLRAVASVIRSIADCERMYVLRTARCPIVRFYHTPSSLHVDISINNLLGAHNSRLLKAYSMFDQRLTPLVRVIRLWMREVTHRAVSSYAVSLMVIHALQHTSPPVLPCLQQLGPWPRNMDWFIECHTPLDHVTCGPWSCDFVPIESLQPSTNKDDLGTLLRHFFTYYCSQFPYQRQIVAIHSLRPISLSEANATLEHPMRSNCDLVIQDPFDRAHNLCKSVTKAMFNVLTSRLHQAMQTLSNEQSNLLDIYIGSQGTHKPRHPSRMVVLNRPSLQQLLTKRNSPLAPVLSELELTNQIAVQALCRVIAHEVVSMVTEAYGFNCQPVIEDHVTKQNDHVTKEEGPQDMSPCDDHMTESMDHVSVPEDHMTRKRQRSSSPVCDDGNKRVKSGAEAASPLDLLTSLSTPHTAATYHCSAADNTWVGVRKRKRGSLLSSLPASDKPLLQLRLSVVPSSHADVVRVYTSDSVCVICVQPIEDHHKVHCDQWFAVFKPMIIH